MTPATPAAADSLAATLDLAQNVRRDPEGLVALTDTPWLRIEARAFARGGFVEMRYAASLYDAPVRPLLRFWFADGGYREEILPAPTEGAALWLGRAPRGCVDVWISPTNRLGRFDFRIDFARPASFATLARRAAYAPKRLFFALSAGMVGLRDEARLNWRFALGAEPLSRYAAWRAARRRTTDAAFDRPRSDWRAAFCVMIDARGAAPAALERTCASLRAQTYPHVTVVVTEGDSAPARADAELFMLLRAGDVVEPHACACFVEHFARHPQQMIAYADTMGAAPDFKPPWSPTLFARENYIGRAAAFRAVSPPPTAAPEAAIAALLAAAGPGAVGALHRPLFTLAPSPAEPARPSPTPAAPSSVRVSIVVPTRDRVDLLAPCIESVLTRSTHKGADIVIVDNDSVDPRTHAFFEQLRGEPRVQILRQPGGFNFSALCNAGAAATTGEFLVFLNNDTTIVTPDWLERLIASASDPDIGAVGAKLSYPDGATQHVGVLLGMGGVAGHFGSGLPASAPGWKKRNLLPHEVAAVTGACLMVERRKFAAVGGFDAIDLPVELNDVDLCLRLAARGWRSICDAQTTLIHHESATRGGGGLRLQRVHEQERRAFRERWRAQLRDDPYFHPGLSLYHRQPALP